MNKEASIIADIISTTKKFLDSQFNIQLNTSDIKVIIQDDVAFVRLKGLISKAEKEFSKTSKGEELIRNVYRKLFNNSSILLQNMFKNSTGKEVRIINVEIEPEYLELLMVVHFKENIK